MVLGFKNQFTSKILECSKIHTIRTIGAKLRWKKGNSIQFANGVRTKNYKCFKNGWCVSTQKVDIKWHQANDGLGNTYLAAKLYVDGKLITDVETFAKNDGFDNSTDFFNWEGWKNVDFKGVLIHWTNFRY